MKKDILLWSGILVIYGSCLVGAHTKWQLGIAAFFIASGVMFYARGGNRG